MGIRMWCLLVLTVVSASDARSRSPVATRHFIQIEEDISAAVSEVEKAESALHTAEEQSGKQSIAYRDAREVREDALIKLGDLERTLLINYPWRYKNLCSTNEKKRAKPASSKKSEPTLNV